MPHRVLCAALIAVVVPSNPPALRANFLHIQVAGSEGSSVQIIWKPHQGVIGRTVSDQQADVRAMHSVPNLADSMRRWRDSTVRDTVVVTLPTQLVVDMSGGAVLLTAVRADSIRVDAQLTPERGPRVVRNGKVIRVSADGQTPWVERRQ
jgi:hypothetical protein